MDQTRVEKQFKDKQDQKERFEKDLEDLDRRISRLRVLYDQYFMGIEKIEPLHLRGVVEKTFLRSKIPRRGSTSMKFRYRSLQQRFTSYSSYWDRLVRLIEEGKMRRGVAGTRTPQVPGAADTQKKVPLASKRRRFFKKRDGLDKKEVAGAENPRDEFTPSELDALYKNLVEAKKSAGENTDKLTQDVLRKSVDRIVQRVPGKDLRLKITRQKDGKVSLAAVVKKGNKDQA